MENVEFRLSPDGKVFYREKGKDEKRLTRFNKEICEEILGMIVNRFPSAWARLCLLYRPYTKNHVEKDKAEYKIVERFIRCNFGEHDLLTPDIENQIMNFEEVRCPLRGICPDENIICKPKSLIKLSPAEKEIVKYYLNGDTFDVIAQKLGKSPSTVKVQLHDIKKKTGAKNCREIIKVMRIHNL